jgi:hypothetical protein
MNLYQQDVRTLTDEELKVLSAELQEAYYCTSYDEDYGDCSDWSDDDAETRYGEMQAEIHRRYFESLTPEQQAKARGASVLEMLKTNLVFAGRVNQAFDAEFSGKKIGDTFTIRKPTRYLGNG